MTTIMELYGRAVKHEDILKGRVPAPAVANPFLLMLNKYSSVEDKPAAQVTKSKTNN